MRRYGGECLSQWLAQPAVKHEIELVMEELRQVRADCGCEHADTLENGLFRRSILLAAHGGELGMRGKDTSYLPAHLQALLDVSHDGVEERFHLAPHSTSDVPDSYESYKYMSTSSTQCIPQATYPLNARSVCRVVSKGAPWLGAGGAPRTSEDRIQQA